MRAAIVGCGQVSHEHVAAIHTLLDVQICAVVDTDRHRAGELATLAPGAREYTTMDEMLDRERPAAVHICTPPNSHADLAIRAMEAGCHVLVEKPMALKVSDADRMLAVAGRQNVVLSTCHNMLFTPAMTRARRMLAEDRLGEVLYVSTFYGVSPERGYGSSGFHWAWRLPGGLFTNFLPHLISLHLACLQNAQTVGDVVVRPTGSARLATEMTVLTRSDQAFGTMTISARARPKARFLEIYGSKGTLRVDFVRETTVWQRSRRLPEPLAKGMVNVDQVLQLSAGTVTTALAVALGRVHSNPGLPVVVTGFYASVRGEAEPPVSGEDGRAMVQVLESVLAHAEVRAMERIPSTLPDRSPKTATERRLAARGAMPRRVLVTGATGFLGSQLVAALWRCGADVRALIRDPTRVSFDLEQQAEIVVGSVSDADAVSRAMDGVELVFHCAGATRNALPWAVHHEDNVMGTETVLATATKHNARVVHVSSVIVYGFGVRQRPIDEAVPYGADDDRWAHYQRSKIEAEKVAFSYNREYGLPLSVVRLGILYGPGRPVRFGFAQLGSVRICVGRGHNRMPYTDVTRAVDALLLAGCTQDAVGEAFNVVDDPQLPVREVLSGQANEPIMLASLPRGLLLLAARFAERRREANGADTPPNLSRFVIRSAARDLTYDTSKARTVLGW